MTTIGNLSAEHLKQFIERIERLLRDKADLQDNIKTVYAEAKSTGFDPVIMKQVIKLRAKDKAEIEEEEYLLDTYKRALGMLPELDD